MSQMWNRLDNKILSQQNNTRNVTDSVSGFYETIPSYWRDILYDSSATFSLCQYNTEIAKIK